MTDGGWMDDYTVKCTISQDMVLAIPKPSIFAAVLIKLLINMDKEYIELFTAVMGLAIVVIDLICKLKKKKE